MGNPSCELLVAALKLCQVVRRWRATCVSFRMLVSMPIIEGVIKKEKKIFHFSSSVNLSVSYLLKGKGILQGEIFLLSAQKEKAEHMSELSLPPPLTTATPLQNLCFVGSRSLLIWASFFSASALVSAGAGTVGYSAIHSNFHIRN